MINELLSLAKKINDKKKKQVTPYNVFAKWNMNENEHTKLLLSLLRYCDTNRCYAVLYSFLINFAKGRDKMIHYKRPTDVEIMFNHKIGTHSLIDGLVIMSVGNKKFALIIENKIYDAPEQPDQVRRYISHVKNDKNIPLENIWVFYITGDGSKSISKNSYCTEDEVPDTNIEQRFVPLSYSDDILPWLQRDILGARIYPETLTSVVREYVDFLATEFSDKDTDDGDKKALLKELNMNSDILKLDEANVKKLYELFKAARSITDKAYRDESDSSQAAEIKHIYTILRGLIKDLEAATFGRLEQMTENILNTRWKCELKNAKTKWLAVHRGTTGAGGYLQVRCVKEWNSCHMEWCNINTTDLLSKKEYTLCLHAENNKGLGDEWSSKELPEMLVSLPKNVNTTRKYSIVLSIPVSAPNPLGVMSDEELKKFLTELYTQQTDCLFSLLLNDINKYKV